MSGDLLSVREITQADIPLIVNYWLGSEKDYLLSLGVDLSKLPKAEDLTGMLSHQLELPLEQKRAFGLIWLYNNSPVGHSNLNPIVYGETAAMHLHLWNSPNRGKGYGTQFLKLSLPFYFNLFKLKFISCEPYALNEAPSKVLKKSGFLLIKEYVTIPGSLNFEQPVKRWELDFEQYSSLYL